MRRAWIRYSRGRWGCGRDSPGCVDGFGGEEPGFRKLAGDGRKTIAQVVAPVARPAGRQDTRRDASQRPLVPGRGGFLLHTRTNDPGSGGSSLSLYLLCAARAEKVQFAGQKFLHFRDGIV